MLVPSEREPSHPVPGPLRHRLLGSVVVLAVTAIGLVITYAVTHWLWLVIHQGPALTARRLLPPWSIEDIGSHSGTRTIGEGFVVQNLFCNFFESDFDFESRKLSELCSMVHTSTI